MIMIDNFNKFHISIKILEIVNFNCNKRIQGGLGYHNLDFYIKIY